MSSWDYDKPRARLGGKSYAQLAQEVGTKPSTMAWRVDKYGLEKAVALGPTRVNRNEFRGKCLTEWAKELGITRASLIGRIKRHGWQKAVELGKINGTIPNRTKYFHCGRPLSEWLRNLGCETANLSSLIRALVAGGMEEEDAIKAIVKRPFDFCVPKNHNGEVPLAVRVIKIPGPPVSVNKALRYYGAVRVEGRDHKAACDRVVATRAGEDERVVWIRGEWICLTTIHHQARVDMAALESVYASKSKDPARSKAVEAWVVEQLKARRKR